MKRQRRHLTGSPTSRAILAAMLVAGASTMAHAGSVLLYSFESGLEGWTGPGPVNDPDFTTSTFGATNGTKALTISHIPGGYLNNMGYTGDVSQYEAADAQYFSILKRAAEQAALGTRPRFEFDWTIDSSAATGLPAYAQLSMFANSTGGYTNYDTGGLIGGNYGTDFPRLDPLAATQGVTITTIGANQYHVSVPLLTQAEATGGHLGLALDPASHYFQIGFQRNGGFTGSINYAFDNIKISGIKTFSPYTLFSWETPDSVGTPGVNEAFEGWVTTNEVPTPPAGVTLGPGHAQSIVSTGATQGTHAYQIDRTSLPFGFTWGSQFGLSGVGNPTNQTKINDYISRINGAEGVAFDVTYRNTFPAHDPSYTSFFVHFADGTGTFYQAQSPGVDVAHTPINVDTTVTVEIPFSAFVDQAVGSTKSLLIDGLLTGATAFEIGIASNTDDAYIYQIDNFRLLVPDVDGDFNHDSRVDGADFTLWKQNFGTGAGADANGDGKSDGTDFLIWQRNFGAGVSSTATAVAAPEPASWALAVVTMALAGSVRPRSRAL